MDLKFRHIALLMMLALAISCSKDDGDMPGGNEELPPEMVTPIVFSAMQQDEQSVTRSESALSTVTNTFTVYGYKNMSEEGGSYGDRQLVFPGYTVKWTENSAATTTTNTNGWDYVNQYSRTGEEQTIKYWDWSAKAYRFFGVTGRSSGITVDHDDHKAYEITITADGSTDETIAETPYYSHLWFSTGNTEVYPDKPFGQPVQLEYLKPLSYVRFKFIFENPSDAPVTTLTDKSFRPTDGGIIETTGQITVSYPLTGTAVKESYTITPGAGGITEFTQDYYEEGEIAKDGEGHVVSPYYDALESQLSKVYAVLPATNQGTYTLTVSVNGEPKTTVVPAEFMDWKIGYLYTYIFKVHVDYGVSIDVVQSAFTPWPTDFEVDHTVYNW